MLVEKVWSNNVISSELREVQLNYKAFTFVKHVSFLNSLKDIKIQVILNENNKHNNKTCNHNVN